MDKSDQHRLLFSTAIIASLIGYVQIFGNISSAFGKYPAQVGLIILSLSGFFSGLHLLLCANELKHESPLRLPFGLFDDLFRRSIVWLRKIAYDASIDCFSIGLVAIGGTYLAQKIFISQQNTEIDALLIFFSIFFIGALITLLSIIIQLLYLSDQLVKKAEDSYLVRLLIVIAVIAFTISSVLTHRIRIWGALVLAAALVFLIYKSHIDFQADKPKVSRKKRRTKR
jgi:hypothetical protein